MTDDPITEDWLNTVGFRWHQLDRQNTKHWVLWLGLGLRENAGLAADEDLGLELAANLPNTRETTDWFCWFRSDCAGRYDRFIHIRHMQTRNDVTRLVEAITGFPFDPANHIRGSAYTPSRAARLREQDATRMDRQMLFDSPHAKWSDIEKDDTRGRALPEHYEAHEKARNKS